MFEVHPKVRYEGFRGLWSRGIENLFTLDDLSANLCPPNFFPKMENISFVGSGIKTRPAFYREAVDEEWKATGEEIVDVFEYMDTSGSPLFLCSTSGGKLYARLVGALGIGGATLFVDGAWDGRFVAVQWADRIYIMPYTLPTGSLLVWKIGAAAARVACGAAAGAAPTVVSGGAGIMDRGTHLVAYAYETDTGYITKPSASGVYNSIGMDGISVSNILNGPAGTVAKHILMTKRIGSYDGNSLGYEYFFVGKINDNVTTTFVINKYDADLVDSADYLFDQLASVQNARGVFVYNNRLCVYGDKDARNLIRVSNPNEPESFDGVDGNIIIRNKLDGVYALGTLRGLLYIFGSLSTFVTGDNGDIPSSWNVETIANIGVKIFFPNAEYPSFLVATVGGDSGQPIEDTLIVGTTSGLRLFNGAYGDYLDFNLQSPDKTVDTIDTWAGDAAIYINHDTKELFIKKHKWTQFDIIYGDYSEGLAADTIKWSIWDASSNILPPASDTVVITVSGINGFGALRLFARDRAYTAKISQSVDGGAMPIPGDTLTAEITWSITFPPMVVSPGWVHQYCGLKSDLFSKNTISVTVKVTPTAKGFLGTSVYTGTLSVVGDGKREVSKQINAVADRASLELSGNKGIQMTYLDFYGFPLWANRPA